MQVGVIGINHKSAHLHLRECFAKVCQRRFGSGNSTHGVHHFVLLSTCNRTEVYFSSPDPAETHSYLLKIFRQDITENFEHKLYSFFGYDCFAHLCSVTAGLDSAIIAETEIQGQVKNAYEGAVEFQKLPGELHFMFQKSLKTGKKVRSLLKMGRGMPSLEGAIIGAAALLFEDFAKTSVLFVGASEINRKVFLSFRSRGFENIAFCNRTAARTREIVGEESISILPWESLQRWTEYDFILFGTKSPDYLVNAGELPESFDATKLVVDLSVPRNVEPRVGKHPQITLHNIDQLSRVVDKNRKLQLGHVEEMEQLIASSVERQLGIFSRKSEFGKQLSECAQASV